MVLKGHGFSHAEILKTHAALSRRGTAFPFLLSFVNNPGAARECFRLRFVSW
jgi:hypothetical protein